MEMDVKSFDDHLISMIKRKQKCEQVQKIIAKKNLYNATDSTGNNLIHYTVKPGNDKVLQYLINSGSNVDALDAEGRTPLMLVIKNKKWHESMIEKLLKSDSDIYVLKNKGKTVLQMVGEMELIEKKQLKPFLKKIARDCFNDRKKIAKTLLDADWPLTQAVKLQDSELTKIMLQYNLGAEINKGVGRELKTALHLAVERADVDNVKVLLEHNADVNVKDKCNRKPMSYLYTNYKNNDSHKNLNILKMILERIGNELIDNLQVGRILKHGNKEAINLLFETNIDMMAMVDDVYENSIVHLLVQNRHFTAIEQLRNRTFEVDARNYAEETALMIAVIQHKSKVVEFLLDMGANIHAVDESGYTALFLAVEQDEESEDKAKDCVQLLLERGSDVQVEINFGEKPTIFDVILIYKTFSLGDLCIAHLALQEARGTIITQLIRSKIESHKRFKDHFELSKQQLMKEIVKSISLCHLLITTDKKVEQFMCNDDFSSRIEDFISNLSKNYYYFTILRRRISKAKEIILLKRGAARALTTLMEITYERFPHIVDNIIDCLEHQEMRNLIDAFA